VSRRVASAMGKAVQVDTIEIRVESAYGFKLEYDGPPSNFAFNFNLRRYTWAASRCSWRSATA